MLGKLPYALFTLSVVLSVVIHGLWGLPYVVLSISMTWRVLQSGASRRANADRYYILQTRFLGIFLHRIKKSESRGIYHTHPWSWFSIILGSYWDFRQDGRWGLRLFFNYCRAGEAHRLELNRGPVWTLCFRGPKREQWKVVDENGNVLEIQPWQGTENKSRQEYA
jgi:hypothetical protein